jgi:fructose-bisphosphate aldolase, class II
MLVKPHDLFAKARNTGYAIGAFNTSNLELSQAIIGAAIVKQAPVIIQTSEGAIEYAGLKVLTSIVSQLAADTDVPVVLHLDHGKSVEIAKQCIEAGYTSIMIDASKRPLNENMALTRDVVNYAHQRGVWVEAEIGAILGSEGLADLEGGRTPEDMFTKPEDAQQFVQVTGADALAVSVGTIHGAFSGQEYIRFELLKEIEQAVPETPLVLHGASGISNEHLKEAATMNVCKVNVDTEMRIAFERAVKAYFNEEHDKYDPRNIIGPARDAVQAVVEDKIDIFGSAGQAR